MLKVLEVLDTEKQLEDNNEQEKPAIDKNQIKSLNVHLQRPHDNSYTSSSINFNKENKDNIFRKGNSDTWACKECKVTGDKWFMQQHQCKGVSKKLWQKTINP